MQCKHGPTHGWIAADDVQSDLWRASTIKIALYNLLREGDRKKSGLLPNPPPFLVVAKNKMVLPFLSHFCSLVFYYPRFGKIPDFSGFFSRSHCLRAHISARLKLPLSICIALGHSRSSAANLPARQLTYGLVH